MGKYRETMKQALERTEKWELGSPSSALMARWVAHGEEHGFKLNSSHEWWAGFSRALPDPPELRANACGPMHLVALMELRKLGIEFAPLLTVGDVLIDGEPCFGVNRTTLRRCLRAGPGRDESIGLHVWLTFPDFTVVDFTIVSWTLRQRGEPMDLGRPDALMVLGDPDALAPGMEYRPLLVGPEFLWKTGVFQPGVEQHYAAVEREWIRRMIAERQA
jgi:hypothetical protein